MNATKNPNSNNPRAKQRGAVIVTRVSTGEQAKEGTSLESQRDACRAKALALSLPIVAEYEDAGISGGLLLSRPGMQAAIADIQAGRADTLICANLSRYSRDVEHQQTIKRQVRAAGGKVVLCDITLEDTPEGDLMFNFLGGYAQYEREMIRKRSMTGKKKRAEQGIQVQRSIVAFGYAVPSKKDILAGRYPPETLGLYQVVEEQAEIVRMMFSKYTSGELTIGGLAKMLNGNKTPTPRGGQFWRASAIHHMLRNRTYMGEARFSYYHKVADESRSGELHRLSGEPLKTHFRYSLSDDYTVIPCPAIVPEAIWNAAQERMKANLLRQTGCPSRVKTLSGLVRCPDCGGSMIFHEGAPRRKADDPQAKPRGKRVPIYTCYNRFKGRTLESKPVCFARSYRESIVLEAVITAIEVAAQSPTAVQAALEAYRKADAPAPPVTDYRKALREVDQALEQIKQEEGAAIKAQIAGIMAGASPEAYGELFADIAARRKELGDQRGRLTQGANAQKSQTKLQTQDATMEMILQDLHQVMTAESVPPETKRRMMGFVIDHVVCQKEGADIYFLPGVFGENATDPQDTVHGVVTPEVSDLDYGNAVELNGFNIPALSVRRATSTLQLHDGETLVIGGLYSSQSTKETKRIPLLSQLPVLGEFFKSTSTRKTESELLILIQPEIVTEATVDALPPAPGSPQNPPIVRPDVQQGDFDKDFPDLSHDSRSPAPAPVNLPSGTAPTLPGK